MRRDTKKRVPAITAIASHVDQVDQIAFHLNRLQWAVHFRFRSSFTLRQPVKCNWVIPFN